ncbi:hypothetical protein BDZ94DRAFT_1316400 [Collybia nuda]|uniref:Uncharacterized protein n=1 Tax=Collybia nuda TaxID=64659 RepID=A0A9P5XQY4_9AGAR|nr:hypothetical protein BDZ94DRAFT_1316400 [Collybia nuda]
MAVRTVELKHGQKSQNRWTGTHQLHPHTPKGELKKLTTSEPPASASAALHKINCPLPYQFISLSINVSLTYIIADISFSLGGTYKHFTFQHETPTQPSAIPQKTITTHTTVTENTQSQTTIICKNPANNVITTTLKQAVTRVVETTQTTNGTPDITEVTATMETEIGHDVKSPVTVTITGDVQTRGTLGLPISGEGKGGKSEERLSTTSLPPPFFLGCEKRTCYE